MKIKGKAILLAGLCACSFVGAGVALSLNNQNVYAETGAFGAGEYFSSAETLSVVENTLDTAGRTGATVTLSGVNGKDRVSFEYGNYLSSAELSSGFLEMSFLPQTVGVADFDYVLLTMTDALDDAQKLVVAIAPQPDVCGWWGTHTAAYVSYLDNLLPATKAAYTYPSMLTVAGTEQYAVGYNNSFLSSKHIYYRGEYMDCGTNLGGKTKYFIQSEENAALETLSLKFVNDTISVNGRKLATLTDESFMTMANEKLVNTPYENTYNLAYVENLFSSGYCKLSVTYLGCNADSIACHVQKIGMQTLADNGGKVQNSSPMFNVDHDTHAVLGKAFRLPEVKITDLREGNITQKAVWTVIDGSGNGEAWSGSEKTFSTAGEYVLRCSVTLQSGETFFTDKALTVFDVMPKTSFALQAEYKETYFTGERLAVVPAEAKNSLSPSGSVAVSTYLQCDGRTVAQFSDLESVHYHLLTEAGNYVIAYLYQNAYGVVNSLSYSFRVENAYGFDPAFIPVSVTSGKNTPLGDFSVTNYVDGTPENELYRAIYVDGERVFLARGNQTLDGSLAVNKTYEKEAVTLTYCAGIAENAWLYEKSYQVPVVKTTYAEDYIIVQNERGEYTRDGVEVVLSEEELIFQTDAAHTFTLPQAVSLGSFELSFDIKQAFANCDELEVVLRNFYDETKQVVFRLQRAGATTSVLYVNGVYETTLNGSFDNDKYYFDWFYNEETDALANALGEALTKRIATWSDGREFDGFTDGICVVSFGVRGVRGSTQFALKRVNNQAFYNTFYEWKGQTIRETFSDTATPNIRLNGKFDKSAFAFGKTFVIPAACAYDVLSPTSTVYLSVTAPDGAKVLDKVDCSVAHAVTVDKLGRWKIGYYAHDGNEYFLSQVEFLLEVKDATAPKIYVQGALPSEVTVGQTVSIPSAEVFDNFSKCECQVFVLAPNGKRTYVSSGAYTFGEAGAYIVQYYAYDEARNFAFKSFQINVR